MVQEWKMTMGPTGCPKTSVRITTTRCVTAQKSAVLKFTHCSKVNQHIWCDFDRASSLICGNKMPTRCNRGFFFADLITCSTCFGHHYAHHQELKSIIQWLLPVVFRAVVFKLLIWWGAEGYVSGLQDAAPNTTGSNHYIIFLSSWWWA